MSARDVDWFEVGRGILAPGVQLPAPQLCGVCGDNLDFCPACAGAGVTVERDDLGYRRQSQPALDPPSAFDYSVRCTLCRGTGEHVCAPHQCDLCDLPALRYEAASKLHLCLGHRS